MAIDSLRRELRDIKFMVDLIERWIVGEGLDFFLEVEFWHDGCGAVGA